MKAKRFTAVLVMALLSVTVIVVYKIYNFVIN